MKLWATGQSSGVMLTTLKPIKKRVGKSDTEDWYVRAGDPIGLRFLCYPGFEVLTGLKREDLQDPVRICLTAEILN